jgi:hypothetical protein
MEGINWKRMGTALLLAGFFGAGCAYGTSTVEIPGFVMTLEYLGTIFYSRLLIGLAIGLAGGVRLLKGNVANAALRGGILGAVVSVGISFYGGAAVFITAGIVYGAITDVLATKLGKK